jgi:hypothetical protein
MTFQPANTQAPYLSSSKVYPQEPTELLTVLTQRDIEVSSAVNIRVIGIIEPVEFLTGIQYGSFTQAQNKNFSFIKMYALPATNAGATTNILHGLTNVTNYIRIWGTCITNVVDKRSIPYADAVAVNTQISIKIVDPNIVIVNGAAAPNITSGLIFLEYLKTSF